MVYAWIELTTSMKCAVVTVIREVVVNTPRTHYRAWCPYHAVVTVIREVVVNTPRTHYST